MEDENALDPQKEALLPWRLKIVLTALLLLALGVVLVSNRWLSEVFTQTIRNRAELRLVLYAGNIRTELQRTSIVPLLLSKDPIIGEALDTKDFSLTPQRLIEIVDEIGIASILVLDDQGVVVAATDRNLLRRNFRERRFFRDTAATDQTLFLADPLEWPGFDFTYSRRVTTQGEFAGVIVVAVDMAKLERSWASLQDVVFVTDPDGNILMGTEPRWRGRTLSDILTNAEDASAIGTALKLTTDWAQNPPDAYVLGEAALRTEASVPFGGWRITAFTAYTSVREKVNGILALVIMGFSILAAVTFYLFSRQTWMQSLSLQRESAELRLLNRRLSREIAEKERVQKTLAVAEQSLAQSSKLAALGEMSAAVSHELNQPLAAMKTYLAGARLLLNRRRPEEALASFQRIDDLIDRMGAITRQLKSYARKGEEAFEPVDLRASVSSALAMMEPQLKVRSTRISRQIPRSSVMVMVDRLRLEQVIINLLRNALDATKDLAAPHIEILLISDDVARLVISDNGHGIADLNNVFEPFYTTKKPGEGTGLGLAISSGFVADFGGRMIARNAESGGAVFEVLLPLIGQDASDAVKV